MPASELFGRKAVPSCRRRNTVSHVETMAGEASAVRQARCEQKPRYGPSVLHVETMADEAFRCAFTPDVSKSHVVDLLESVVTLEHRPRREAVPDQQHRLAGQGDARDPILVAPLLLGEEGQGIAEKLQRHVSACGATSRALELPHHLHDMCDAPAAMRR